MTYTSASMYKAHVCVSRHRAPRSSCFPRTWTPPRTPPARGYVCRCVGGCGCVWVCEIEQLTHLHGASVDAPTSLTHTSHLMHTSLTPFTSHTSLTPFTSHFSHLSPLTSLTPFSPFSPLSPLSPLSPPRWTISRHRFARRSCMSSQ